ncbi:Protein kinase domain-containing protein [Mycena sanguinolenta]|uniref:Protein kinase domain-containing protein n=1 Tax=Mycena sanguinolenta TaxID=230812 RepID=A0A8H7D0G7_9AGAR|nr:Protein kinase domain-containing protein [Mycena sanguinolenta]
MDPIKVINWEIKPRKRPTSDQLKVLESVFERDTKPSAALRKELASQLSMTARSVQNRRARVRPKAAKVAKAASKDSDSPSSRSSEDPDESSAGELPLPDESASPTDTEPPQFDMPSLHMVQNCRGSLPINAFNDLAARLGSVDASLVRVANNPYAPIAQLPNDNTQQIIHRELRSLVDLLQDLLDSSHELTPRALFSKALLRLSDKCGLHPTCFTLTGLKKMGQQVAGGGFGDIWKGMVGGQTVAVKSMRQFAEDDVKASLKKLGREATIWRQLSHPNLLPFFGLYVLDNRPCLISPWMENGDLRHFLSSAPPDTDRISLIADVAMGLEYLHDENIVHGDLKTPNILVTPSGRACITDFGLSTIVDELSLKMTFSSRNGRAGTVRYQAPELLKGSSNHYGSDVYAFGCVFYEILTGEVPFLELANEAAIILKVVEGVRPSRLETISPELWLLLEDCWHQEIDRRPTMADVLHRLLDRQPIGGEIEHYSPPPPDWDDTYSARFRRSIRRWPHLPSIDEIERRLSSQTTNNAAQAG